MTDKEPNPEKQKKSRSFGAMLLILTVVVAILVALGQESASKTKTLSMDQFLYRLHSGGIETLEIKQTEMVGKLRGGKERFEVALNPQARDANSIHEQYRQLVADGANLKEITPETLLAAVNAGVYAPSDVRSLTKIELQRSEVAVGAAPGETKEPKEPPPKITEELFVRVRYQSGAASLPAELPTPAAGSVLHLKVQGQVDQTSLIASLQRAGAKLEELTFNTTEGGGTRNAPESSMLQLLLLSYAPWILIIVVFILFMRQMRAQGGAGGVMSFGRSRAQLYTKENHTNVTFDDVAGAQEAKDEVREVVEFLKNPSRFTRIGGRIPRGVLLVGPPGCGKTLLAKAIAGEAEVPFFSISGSDFVEMFVGVGASRVRDLFKQARENSPCIIFLDEIDAVGRRRGSGMGGGHDEREQTLNAILVEMDGFGTDEGIIVIAATNRPDVLDPALLRPGRFDREVTIELPDFEGREEILRVHLKKVKAGPDAEPRTIAKLTPGYSGADLAAIVNEAAIRAALNKKDAITLEDLDEAREKVRYGRQKKSRKVEIEDKKITAYHEAGHTVVAATIPEVDDPHKVSIVPRGRSLGVTWIMPDKESYHMQKKRMVGQLALCFGGRAAEEEFCGDISAGAFDDIKRATEMAKAMVTELGMSEKIGPINYAERQGSEFLGAELGRGRDHSEATAREIDEEVRRLLNGAHERAVEIVRAHRAEVERIAQALLLYETINGEEIARLIKGDEPSNLRPQNPGPSAPATTEKRAPLAGGKVEPGPLGPGAVRPGPGLSPA
jgi:cell division protease FtsH